MSPAAELVLDREVRDWVLLPLTACVLLMQLLRQYVTQVRSGRDLGCSAPRRRSPPLVPAPPPPARRLPTRPPAPPTLPSPQLFVTPKASPADPAKTDELRRKMALARSGLLRANAGWIPEGAFRQRKAYFIGKVGATLIAFFGGMLRRCGERAGGAARARRGC